MFRYISIFSEELKSLICGFFTVQRTSPPAPLHRRGEQGAGIPLFFVCLLVRGGSVCSLLFLTPDETNSYHINPFNYWAFLQMPFRLRSTTEIPVAERNRSPGG